MKYLRYLLPALLVLPLPLTSPPQTLAQEVGLDAREWNQVRGNAGRTGSVAVRPLAAQPGIAWEHQFKNLQSDPVTWGGQVYVVADKSLIVLDSRSGTEITRKRLHADPCRLAVWQGTVMVSRKKEIRAMRFTGTSFKHAWKRSGVRSVPPAVHDGMVFAAQGEELVALDARTGKLLKGTARGNGMPCVLTRDGKTYVAAPITGEKEGSKGTFGWVIQTQIKGGKAPFGSTVSKELGKLKDDAAGDLPKMGGSTAFVVRIDPKEGGTGALLVNPGLKFAGGVAGRVLMDGGNVQGRSEFVTEPVAHRGLLYGFNRSGDLVWMNEKGNPKTLIPAKDLPKGAKPGEGSLAGDVAFFGNWAIDLTHRRVLWSMPDLAPVSPAIPSGDNMLVMAAEGNRLIGLADPASIAAAGDEAADDEPPPELPGAGDGVWLADGRWLAGPFEGRGSEVVCKPTGGEEVTADWSDVVFAFKDGEIDFTGNEGTLHALCRRGLHEATLNQLEILVGQLVEAGLVSDATRIVGEMHSYGMSRDRDGRLQKGLTGKRDHPNAKVRRKRWTEEEKTLRTKLHADVIARATWAYDSGFPTAATALLAVADKIQPGQPSIAESATKWMSEDFPWREAPDAAAQWMRWSLELVPAGAEFCGPRDNAWNQARSAPWNEEGTIALRSPNLLFFSRSVDPAVVGGCLRNGEGAVRALRILLDVDEKDATVDSLRLDVRLHENRKSYLTEVTPSGFTAMPWSAGYFSPSERVSRFHVSDRGGDTEILGRDLYKTLVHELTHHYLSCHWLPHMNASRGGGSPTLPGYWIVEGFARFVEDQSVELGRRGFGFDDATVPSVDCTQQMLAADALFPCGELVETNYKSFNELGKERGRSVTLKNTLTTYHVSKIHLFYEQSGTLVFFMMNGRGPEGRKTLVKYMLSRYKGALTGDTWKQLGFDTAEDLDKAFKEYLVGLAK